MDATITYDEVAALVGVNIPTLEPRRNFERIRTLRRHFERALQRLPCPQSVQYGWKGMVMARELYNLLTVTPFRLPTNPGAEAIYTRVVMAGQPINNTPLSRTEQASIDSLFNRHKHYFLSMQNIERACFTALDASINEAFKVSNDPNVRGWHAGMRVIDILNQLSSTYGQPTPAALEANDHIFRSPTSAANAPEVLFRHVEECAEKALLGQNSCTDKQLITNTTRLLLTTGLYVPAFKDWDQLDDTAKTWIELRRMIQEAFQRRLNATAPTAGHQGYNPALPFQQNAFGALSANDSDNDSARTVATQMAALPAHGNDSRQLVPANGPVHPNTGQAARTTPPKSAPDDGANGCIIVQPERCRQIHWTPRTWPTSSPICPLSNRTQQLWRPWRTGRTWTGTRSWARSTRIHCRTCTPTHVYHSRKGTTVHGTDPSNRRRIFYATTSAGATDPGPPVFKPHKEVCKLECMLFLWV